MHDFLSARAATGREPEAPQTKILTSQQAADILGVSRPTTIRLLDDGELPYGKNRTSQRRLLLRDVVEYAKRRREQQYAALAAMSLDIDEDDNLEEELTHAKQARKTVAARRAARV